MNRHQQDNPKLMQTTEYGTHLVDEGKAVHVVCLAFSKAFDNVSHSVLLQKLAAHGLDEHELLWENNLAGWPGPKSGGDWS
ncbi:hypothetical protein QYF61_010284 [Mycteria americana]|uniref:Reverse transcriptase n=1 Tax=Mycteria americana TaxID=33587 RepID=A0AAN7RK45_MYCAM|nr:hypothetical protein QYF61_010284 [Mycteria americana]